MSDNSPEQAAMKSKMITPAQFEEMFEISTESKPPVVPRKRNIPMERITPLTEEQWAQMDGKARWDSTVALRGPDIVGSTSLKWFTSSVIRYKLSGIMRVGGLVNSHLPFVVLPGSGLLERKKGSFDPRHFCEHIYEAAMWLQIPIAYISREAFNSILLSPSDHYYHAAAALLDHLQDPYRETLLMILKRSGYNPPTKTEEVPDASL